jgi:hypothetical protein
MNRVWAVGAMMSGVAAFSIGCKTSGPGPGDGGGGASMRGGSGGAGGSAGGSAGHGGAGSGGAGHGGNAGTAAVGGTGGLGGAGGSAPGTAGHGGAGIGGVAGGAAGGAGGAAGVGGGGGVVGGSFQPLVIYPAGTRTGAVVLIAGDGVSMIGEVLFGSVHVAVQPASAGSVTATVPSGIAAGTVTVKAVMQNGSTVSLSGAFTVLGQTPSRGWTGPSDFVPTIEPAGYIGPIDNVWQNEYDSSDRYAFSHQGSATSDVVTITNMNGFDPLISGTLDRRTGLFRFSARRLDDSGDAGAPQEFVGVYSNADGADAGAPPNDGTDPQHFARLVFFPVDSGPELIVHVEVFTP